MYVQNIYNYSVMCSLKLLFLICNFLQPVIQEEKDVGLFIYDFVIL
jgi:hypothetical protein